MDRSSNILQEFIKNRAVKKEYLGQIARLAREQAAYIASEATEQLLATIQEREGLAGKIDLLDEQNDKLALWLKEHMVKEYSSLSASGQQILVLLQEIQAIDQENKRCLRQAIGNCQGQLGGLRQSRHTINAYTSAYTSEEGTYFDVKQ